MSSYHEKTRDIYHKQHTRIVYDEKSNKRIKNLYPEEYFCLENGWFKGKTAFDAGCGDTLLLSICLAEFGAKNVTSMDIGTDWMKNAQLQIQKYHIHSNTINLIEGNVLNIPQENESFDFVACNGVLCHLANLDEVELGFSEGARILKSGGYYYTTLTIDGGLMEDAIFPAIRQYYNNNQIFKDFIDNISPNDFERIFNQIKNGLKKYENFEINSIYNADLFDEDLCVTIQNYIQGPRHFNCSQEYIKKLYGKYGFEEIQLLKRYVKYDNIRKYLSPLKFERESKISQILWGNGFIEFIGKKI